jgi:hypothetical protein
MPRTFFGHTVMQSRHPLQQSLDMLIMNRFCAMAYPSVLSPFAVGCRNM